MKGSRKFYVYLFFMWLCMLAVPSGVRCMAQMAPDGGAADSMRTVFSGVLYFSRGNADWIERADYKAVGRFLRAAQRHPGVLIRLRGWADTTGTAEDNQRVSARRAAAVGRYLMRNGVDSARIRTEGFGEDAVSAPQLARRVEMWGVAADGAPFPGVRAAGQQAAGAAEAAVAGNGKERRGGSAAKAVPPPAAQRDTALLPGRPADTAGTIRGQKPEQKQKQDPKSGQTPKQDLKQDLKQRPQEAVKQNPQQERKHEAQRKTKQETTQQPEQEPEQRPQTEQTSPGKVTPSSGRYLGVKTNLAAWAGTIMNIAADVQVGKHVSVELPLLWCPWYVSDKHAIKTFTLQPEARYWLSEPGEGHFFGVHAHVGWFNVKWDRDRYQDAGRPLLGAGISYGYLLPFNEHWAGEFTLGAGYANMRYDTYYNIGNGARIDTRTRNYWGITRAGLSVVYRFRPKK